MKILNEQEQLKKRRDEVHQVINFIQSEREAKSQYARDIEDSWFVPAWKKRWAKFVADEYAKVTDVIMEYSKELNDRIKP